MLPMLIVSGDSATRFFLLLFLCATVFIVYIDIMVYIKRSHDRNKHGAFAIVMFIPYINLWPLIEFGFIKGKPGDNKYGPDPLA